MSMSDYDNLIYKFNLHGTLTHSDRVQHTGFMRIHLWDLMRGVCVGYTDMENLVQN